MFINTPAGTTRNASPEAAPSPAAVTVTRKPISLRQSKVRLSCGTFVLRIDLYLENAYHTYSLGVFPGFEGGGKDTEHGMVPRVPVAEYTPKALDPLSGRMVPAWPPTGALERRVDGEVWDDTHLPEGTTTQRLERALCKVEPMLRQLVNQRQAHLEAGKPGQVADQPLIARIKALLADY